MQFCLNSFHQEVDIWANMEPWNRISLARCPLCGWSYWNLRHILTGCKVALDGKRYIWRYDQVLRAIGTTTTTLKEKLETPTKSRERRSWCWIWRYYRRSKISGSSPGRRLCRKVLSTTHCQHTGVSLTPDIVMYSDELKTSFLMELTVQVGARATLRITEPVK